MPLGDALPKDEGEGVAGRIELFEKAVRTEEFRTSVFRKAMERCYPNHMMREHGFEEEGAKIYAKIREGRASKEEWSDWHWRVTKMAVEKLCHIVNYLLANGPLTEVENKVVDDSVVLIRSYYFEKCNLFEDKEILGGTSSYMMYFPVFSSPIHKILEGDGNFLKICELFQVYP